MMKRHSLGLDAGGPHSVCWYLYRIVRGTVQGWLGSGSQGEASRQTVVSDLLDVFHSRR
jgi:hypothetical protein